MTSLSLKQLTRNSPRQESGKLDSAHSEAAPGPHQKLVRQNDGRYLLIVREASGFIRRLPVMVFEGGFAV